MRAAWGGWEDAGQGSFEVGKKAATSFVSGFRLLKNPSRAHRYRFGPGAGAKGGDKNPLGEGVCHFCLGSKSKRQFVAKKPSPKGFTGSFWPAATEQKKRDFAVPVQ